MDIESLIVQWLKSLGYAASSEVPKPRPGEFVTVERVGGQSAIGLDYPRVVIQCWSSSRANAAKLAQDIDLAAEDLMSFSCSVSRVTRTSRLNWPDPDSGQARYQIVLDLVHSI